MQSQNQTRNRRIKRIVGRCLAALALLAVAAGCAPTSRNQPMHSFKETTITYGVGRFVVDIPAAMSFAGGYHMRNRKLEEIVWRNTDTEKAAEQAWNKRLTEIEAMSPPQGVVKALIETRDFPDIQKWCWAVFYYGDPLDIELPGIPLKGYLDILCHTGRTDLWITSYGKSSAKDFMYSKSTDIARAYRAPRQRFGRAKVIEGRDAFYLRYGAVDLPFEYQESVDIVFRRHALDDALKIWIMTRVVRKENKIGLLERAANSLMTQLASDLKIEKLRSGTRTVAGIQGEELIERFTDDARKTLSFTWMHLGKKDSAHCPHVIIDMESNDGRLEEKLALWDAVLDSVRPAGR
jgi:hypothetical protein